MKRKIPKPTDPTELSEWEWMNPQPKGACSNPGPVREVARRPPHSKRLRDFRKEKKEMNLIGSLVDPDAQINHVRAQAREVHGEDADSWLDQEWSLQNRLSHALDIWERYLWNLLEEDRARWFELGGPPFAPTNESLDWRDEFQRRENARELAFRAAFKLISRFANENGLSGDAIRQSGSVQIYLYACLDDRRMHWPHWPLDTLQKPSHDADDELAIKMGTFALDAVRERIAELSKPRVIRFLDDVTLPETGQSFNKGSVHEFIGWDAQEWIGSGSAEAATRQVAPDSPTSTRKPQKSFSKGEAAVRLIAAISNHHKYGADSLQLLPIGCNALRVTAGVSKGAASKFFKSNFGSHADYVVWCKQEKSLLSKLTKLNDEYGSPKNRPLRDDE